MKLRGLFILLSVLLSCSKKNSELLITGWEKKIKASPLLIDRNFASESQGKCFKDNFKLERLKSDVKAIESKYLISEKIQGTWKHIDLSTLPVPQAQFLKKFGKDIGDLKDPERIDYSSCEDLPCIINKIYGDKEELAGLVHYLWYLKMGYMLASDNFIPYYSYDGTSDSNLAPGMYKDKEYPFESFLLSRSELYAFWRLTYMLPEYFSRLSRVTELQKLPKGAPMGVCGVSPYSGQVTFTDSHNCYNLSENIDGGGFNHVVIHELSHQIDYDEGSKMIPYSVFLSTESEYLRMSGMDSLEAVGGVNSVTNKWFLKPGFNAISQYSRKSPPENFAETVAYYRILGSVMKKTLTEELFNFIGARVYDGKSFDNETTAKDWISSYQPFLQEKILDTIVKCSDPKVQSLTSSKFIKQSDLKKKIRNPTLYCLDRNLFALAGAFVDKMASEKPEGCEFLKQDLATTYLREEIKKNIISNLNQLLLRDVKGEDSIELKNAISNETPANETYVSCYGKQNESDCFVEKLNQNLESLEDSLSSSTLGDFSDVYFTSHTYEITKKRVLEAYSVIARSNIGLITTQAEMTWKGCLSLTPNDTSSPTGSDFSVGDAYLVSSVYNCINANVENSLNHLLSQFSLGDLELQNDNEKLILKDFMKPIFINELKSFFETSRKEELDSLNEWISKNGLLIKQGLLSSDSWFKDLKTAEEVMSSCEREALNSIPKNPLYHLKRDFFLSFIKNEVCHQMTSKPEIMDSLSKNAESLKLKKPSVFTPDSLIKLPDIDINNIK